MLCISKRLWSLDEDMPHLYFHGVRPFPKRGFIKVAFTTFSRGQGTTKRPYSVCLSTNLLGALFYDHLWLRWPVSLIWGVITESYGTTHKRLRNFYCFNHACTSQGQRKQTLRHVESSPPPSNQSLSSCLYSRPYHLIPCIAVWCLSDFLLSLW